MASSELITGTTEAGLSIGDHKFIDSLSDKGRESLAFYFQKAFSRKSVNTQRAYKTDLAAYVAFCEEYAPNAPLFLSEQTQMRDRIDAYIDAMIEQHNYKKATLQRRLNILRTLLGVMDVANPFENKGYADYFNARLTMDLPVEQQAQAKPFKEDDLIRVNKRRTIDALGLRNLTMLNVAFDSLLRASELAQVQWTHIDEHLQTLLVPRSKSNRGERLDYRSLSKTTLSYLRKLKEATPTSAKYVFNALVNTDDILVNVTPLSYQSVYHGLMGAMEWGGLNSALFSAHSTRVGAALSMREKGISLSAIAEAGGWRSLDMVRRYLQAIDARHSGSSQLAAMSGR